jgi:hypothetical protein
MDRSIWKTLEIFIACVSRRGTGSNWPVSKVFSVEPEFWGICRGPAWLLMILSYSFVKPAAKSYTPLNGTHPSRAEIANPFLNANPDIPTYKQAKAEYAKLQWQRAIIQRPTGSGGCQLTQSGDFAH